MEYSFGWRRQNPDSRDFKLQFHHGFSAALPDSMNLNEPTLPAPFNPSWDQEDIGSCGPNSLGENIVYDALTNPTSQLKKFVVGADGKVKMPSRLFMYYTTRMLMNTTASDSGVDNRTMLKALATYGFCDEEMWPYDTSKFAVKPPQACFDAAAERAGLAIKYEAVGQTLNDMRGCIAILKRPFIFGFTVHESMLTDAVARTGDVPMPGGFMDGVAGGHDVLMYAYDNARQVFYFRNHWYQAPGKPWGNNGSGTIPYAYAIDPNQASDFLAVTSVETGSQPSPKPDPTPTPTPTPPASLKDKIDKIFADLEKQYARYPSTVSLLKRLNSIIDNLLGNKLGDNYRGASYKFDPKMVIPLINDAFLIAEGFYPDKKDILEMVRLGVIAAINAAS